MCGLGASSRHHSCSAASSCSAGGSDHAQADFRHRGHTSARFVQQRPRCWASQPKLARRATSTWPRRQARSHWYFPQWNASRLTRPASKGRGKVRLVTEVRTAVPRAEGTETVATSTELTPAPAPRRPAGIPGEPPGRDAACGWRGSRAGPGPDGVQHSCGRHGDR